MLSLRYYAIFIKFPYTGMQAINQLLQSLEIDNKGHFIFLLPKDLSKIAYGFMEVKSLAVLDKVEKQLGATQVPIEEYTLHQKARYSQKLKAIQPIDKVVRKNDETRMC